MTPMILGLLIFLGLHSVRIFADDWRTAMRARLGENGWKGLYSLVSLAGFGLLLWGYGLARQQPVVVWSPPVFMRHIAAPLMVLSFILLVAAYVPRNGIKARLHHPMTLAVKVWALAHLLANGTLHDIILFGGFLVWSVLLFRSARKRDAAAGTVYPPGKGVATAVTVVAGIAVSVLFAHWLHRMLIGVSPF
ncbi:protein NrnU [Duganella sp. BJB488]|uniref:NnrU family protein n=1 Tax=unclassified Duganella TaxID=2636909 RepID=UPI000E3579F0|nr:MULTISPECIES: NnrU family protein [unclassified Duganella]NVD69939.1 NnrU family protein [Duganella sp. BJB1802]RFP12266.1 protein NrnU [Duganella sp. BJB488]RFP20094.1 protein NrnU [Duganella sp. BJB489]RFP33599.1 protein NrnU [Duganella sp. BJB480]